MTDAADLTAVETAITAALQIKSMKLGDFSKENQSLTDLFNLKREIQGRIKRSSRGPRVQGIRLRHG